MCWSYEVSIATSIFNAFTVIWLLTRRYSGRDIWNATFIAVFGSMQLIDAMLWHLDRNGEDLSSCSDRNRLISVVGLYIVSAEPFAALAGRCFAVRKLPSIREILMYAFWFGTAPWIGRQVAHPYTQCALSRHNYCTQLTADNHLLIGAGIDPQGGIKCWLEHWLTGSITQEIPLILRFAFLLGMIYPYLSKTGRTSQPLGFGIFHSTILTVSWLIGFMSDSHASVWCAANVIQGVLALADPWVFSAVGVTGSPIKRSKRQSILQDRYSKRAVPSDLDAIVIGSGIGGLANAAILARAGKRVLVLEQHYRAGGCTHTFDEIGGNLFDSGIHYVGARKQLHALLSCISDFAVRFVPMGSKEDGFTYDEFDLGSEPSESQPKLLHYARGRTELQSQLIEMFPHEEQGIRNYMKHVYAARQTTDRLAMLKILPQWLIKHTPIGSWLYTRTEQHTSRTADEVVAEHISDPKLRALLSAGQLIDWNLEPDRTSWWVVAAMMNYYAEGGFYPEGGSHRIAEAIIPVIERSGGRVLCRAHVDCVLTDSATNAARGVRLDNGDEILAPVVISDAGTVNTWEKLVPAEAMAKAGLKSDAVRKVLGDSHGHITAFVSLDGPSEKFDLRPANIHSFPDLPKYDFDVSKMQRAFYADPWCQKQPLITLTCPSAKDPLYDSLYPGQSNVLLLSEANSDWFRFEGKQQEEQLQQLRVSDGKSTHGHRSIKYKDLKARFEPLFLERLYKYYPKTRGHVKSIEIGTPLTSAFYLEAPNGGSYGLEWTPERFDRQIMETYCSPTTKIPGLYLTGEGSFFGGFAGALTSGYITSLKVLGVVQMLKTILLAPRVWPDDDTGREAEAAEQARQRFEEEHGGSGGATTAKKVQ
jgi:phytoene dehydrogenase-like protein